jgi:hypothetical protein
MTREIKVLVEICGDDRELLELLYEVGAVRRGAAELDELEIEQALVARTLIRELDVNAPGVEIILRMRSQLLAQQRQVRELLALLKKSR